MNRPNIAAGLLIGFFALYSSFPAAGQVPKEKELKTEIKEVTVFFKGAQVFESGSVAIPAGKSLLQVKGLSPYLDEKSLQVKATGAFTILGVNHRLNYLQKLKRDDKIDSLSKKMEAIEALMAREKARLEVLKEKMSLLNENKKLSGQTTVLTMAQLKQAIDFYEAEIGGIKEEELKILNTIEKQKMEQAAFQNHIAELNKQPALPASEVDVLVQADNPVNGQSHMFIFSAQALACCF